MAISVESLMARSESAARAALSDAEQALNALPVYRPTNASGAEQIEAKGIGLILQTAEQSLLSVGTAVERLRKLGIEPLTATKPETAGGGK